MKHLVKRLLPQTFVRRIQERLMVRRVRREARRDVDQYLRHAILGQPVNGLGQHQLEGLLTQEYHRVEKALALPTPRRPFGADVVNRIDGLVPFVDGQNGGAPLLKATDRARTALVGWNSGDDTRDEVAPLGVLSTDAVNRAFFDSRRSVRHFSDQHVPDSLLDTSTSIAAASPSVCNRAPWKVRFLRDDLARRALSFQNGNRGFGDQVPVVAVISVEIGLFQGTIERYQPWIEGGIFSSTLVWALHSVGLASCMLNLSLLSEARSNLAQALGIPDSEYPIVMIAIGYPAQQHRVALSPRRESDVVRVR